MFFDKEIFPSEFKKWIWQDRYNRIFIILSLLATIILFKFFLRFYPFPNFLPDSYSYIDGAFQNLSINMWPVGYSKFLRLVSVFNHTDKGLFFVQYAMLEAAIVFFLLTIRYLLAPGKWEMFFLGILLVLNPLWLFVSNFVSSDALFSACSLFWMTTLIWMVKKPGRRLLLLHGLVLVYCFSIRYNALYYPVITLIVIFFSRSKRNEKLIWSGLAFLPVLCFVSFTMLRYQKETNTFQFSPFGGWQMAANAMYMYAHVSPETKEPVPAMFKKLHGITIHHMDSVQHLKPQQRPDKELGIYYLWNDKAPLKEYLISKYKKDSTTPYLKRWANVAPLYGQYGTWLIKQYPVEYFMYYLLPNLVNYYAPSAEFLGIYNMGADSVDREAVQWFQYKSAKVKGYSKDKKIRFTNAYSVVMPIINIVFFAGFLGFIFIGGFKQISSYYRSILYLILLIWAANLGFSVIASPIVMRYQVFPFIFTSTFGILLFAYFVRESFFVTKKEPVIFSEEVIAPIQVGT